MVNRKIVTVLALCLLASCGKDAGFDLKGLVVPPSGDVEVRVGESLKLNGQRGPQKVAAEVRYRLYVCADVHYDGGSDNWREWLVALHQDTTAAAGLLLGDIAWRRGELASVWGELQNEAERVGQAAPVYAVVGNHDLFFEGWKEFKSLWGSSTYSVTIETPEGEDLVVMLDSGGGCHGKRQLEWLREVLKTREKYRHVIVCTHVNLFRTDLTQFVSGNLPREETYALMDLLSRARVDLLLQGHDHCRGESLYKGVRCVTLDCLKDGADNASYMVIEVGENVEYEFMDMQ